MFLWTIILFLAILNFDAELLFVMENYQQAILKETELFFSAVLEPKRASLSQIDFLKWMKENSVLEKIEAALDSI